MVKKQLDQLLEVANITSLEVAKNKAAQELGKRGGQKTVALYGNEHFKKIAKGWPKGKKRKPEKETPELVK